MAASCSTSAGRLGGCDGCCLRLPLSRTVLLWHLLLLCARLLCRHRRLSRLAFLALAAGCGSGGLGRGEEWLLRRCAGCCAAQCVRLLAGAPARCGAQARQPVQALLAALSLLRQHHVLRRREQRLCGGCRACLREQALRAAPGRRRRGRQLRRCGSSSECWEQPPQSPLLQRCPFGRWHCRSGGCLLAGAPTAAGSFSGRGLAVACRCRCGCRCARGGLVVAEGAVADGRTAASAGSIGAVSSAAAASGLARPPSSSHSMCCCCCCSSSSACWTASTGAAADG